jgi:hypothetical protein
MKKLFSLLLLVVASFSVSAQKVSYDDDTIYVDKTPYAVLEKSGGSLSSDMSLKSLDGKEQVYFKFLEYNDRQKINSSNPQGRIIYFEVTFFGDGQKCEIRHYASKKKLAELIVENKLLNGNAVDADSEKRFVTINGKTFSEQRDRDAADIIIITH